MKIGLPKEIKNLENRVAMTPANVYSLIANGHKVYVQKGAGLGASIEDEKYKNVGAIILDDAADVWALADMIVKVKEPIEEEFKYFREGLLIFTFLHLAGNELLTKELLAKKVTAIGYETMELNGILPLLSPMSEVAGRYAIQVGAHFLEKHQGGKGILLGGVPGTGRGKVVVIGGGIVGANAAHMAKGLGADVTILDMDMRRLAELDREFNHQIETLASNRYNLTKSVREADIVIGSVLISGSRAPVLVTEEMVKSMSPGSVIIDVAIDQGGNFETSTHPTTHDDPVYIKHGVVHYTVSNMPGAIPNTATYALTNASGPYIDWLANYGLQAALDNETILTGINTYDGHVTNQNVANSLDLPYQPFETLI